MLSQIEAIAREAGKIILTYRDAAVHQKEGHCNFVTDADVSVQNFLKKELLSLCPGACFFAEEQENTPLTNAPTFVVDPIDGTTNFMRGRNLSCISIAYLENKTPLLALVYNPYANEMFTAEKGKGAFLNGEPIHVSQFPFQNAIVAYGTSPYDAELAKTTMKLAEQFLLQAGDLRRTGSAAIDLTDVACGRADIMFELRLRPWDVAAGSLLITEAGGYFFSLGHDAPYYDDACGIWACTPACFEKAKQLISEVLS